MSQDKTSTRRAFLKGGALMATPLAAAPVAALADDGLKARLTRLEDHAAIKALHESWLRHINAGATGEAASLFANPSRAALGDAVRGVAPDHAGSPDRIEIAANGKSATGRFHCLVETASAIPKDCTAAQMAHLQGGGHVHRTERRALEARYVKTNGAWAIDEIEIKES